MKISIFLNWLRNHHCQLVIYTYKITTVGNQWASLRKWKRKSVCNNSVFVFRAFFFPLLKIKKKIVNLGKHS